MSYPGPYANNLMLICYSGFREEYFTACRWGASFFLEHQTTALTNTVLSCRGEWEFCN